MKQRLTTALLLVIGAVTLPGCDKTGQQADLSTGGSTNITPNVEQERVVSAAETAPAQDIQFEIENTRYLFDVTNHSVEELEALLQRAEEITETHATGYEELDIVLILHGPDIDLFTTQNYDRNKRLVDLAAKLDAFDIIDLKMCETTMSGMGVTRGDIPAFIESVPYAPEEIKRLTEEGYINL